MLRSLHLKDVGPAPELKFEFAPRLNLLTGDNGLGKTFVLDVIWYALTWSWAGEKAIPRDDAKLDTSPYRVGEHYLTAEIGYGFNDNPGSRSFRCNYHTLYEDWRMRDGAAGGRGAKRMEESLFPEDGIVLFARVDGSFAVWDPYRNRGRHAPVNPGEDTRPASYLFDQRTIWEGLGAGRSLCQGLLRDWVTWQHSDSPEFHHLASVLAELSGDGSEALTIGPPSRPRPPAVDELPTLKLAYDTVPLTQASSGMRRICALAYMVVWAWREHQRGAELHRAGTARTLTLLLDEVECHLHPAWQRRVLPAILRVLSALSPDIEIQVIAATHAPLVLASLEPRFDVEKDALFAFDLVARRGVNRIAVERAAWRRMGDVSNWLTSPVFDLKAARSREAEDALEAAMKALDNPKLTPERAQAVHRQLHGVLKDTDPFWARWMMTAEKLGIEP